jgi:hypothetical protein
MFLRSPFQYTRQAVLALMLAAAISHEAHAVSAGTVIFSVGDVSAASANGEVRPLLKGNEIGVGDTIITGGNGRVQVRFSDGALSSFQPDTRFRVDEYQYKGKADGSERGFFSLLKGTLRTITGAIGQSNKKSYLVTTPTATIGIRGTEYLAREGNSLSVSVGEGQIEVCNAAGCLVVADGESAFVKDGSTQPVYTQKKAEAGPPPQQQPKPDEFKTGETRSSSGNPAIIPAAAAVAAPVVIPLANGAGGVALATVSNAGSFSAGLLGGTLTFNAAGALTQSIDCCTSSNNFTAGASSDFGADGIIGWGRWTSGLRDTTPQLTMNYVAVLNANVVTATSIVRGYTSFASTAPTVTSGGTIVATGAPNTVTGTLSVNFTSMTGGGSLAYTLNIPVAGQTFNINGNANQFNGTGFLGSTSTISSTGAGCTTSCTGNIPFGNAIQGVFTGPNAERAGANYGFTSAIGQVTGAVVFK